MNQDKVESKDIILMETTSLKLGETGGSLIARKFKPQN
jgi:hypothetical protein